MAGTTTPNKEPRWSLVDLVILSIVWFMLLALVAAGTGVGWCLGALGGQAGKFLGVPGAVHFSGILGGVAGSGYTLYRLFRRPKLPLSGRTISDEQAREKQHKHAGLAYGHRGWDHFITDVGTAESKVCPVCQEVMEVERDIPGRPGFNECLFGMALDHDLFLCPFREEGWHQQALELLKWARETPSVSLQRLLEEEARTILADRKPTKGAWQGRGPHTRGIAG